MRLPLHGNVYAQNASMWIQPVSFSCKGGLNDRECVFIELGELAQPSCPLIWIKALSHSVIAVCVCMWEEISIECANSESVCAVLVYLIRTRDQRECGSVPGLLFW